MEETNVNFIQKMYGNWWIYPVVHQNMCRRYITVSQTLEYKQKWICFYKETAFSEPNNILFTKCIPTDFIFIEGKVKLFGTEKENSNKGCTKMFYIQSKSINTFDISENIFPLILLLFRWMFFMSRIEILLFCNKVTVTFLGHVFRVSHSYHANVHSDNKLPFLWQWNTLRHSELHDGGSVCQITRIHKQYKCKSWEECMMHITFKMD